MTEVVFKKKKESLTNKNLLQQTQVDLDVLSYLINLNENQTPLTKSNVA